MRIFCAILLGGALSAGAQGTVDFKNIALCFCQNAPFFEEDGTTPLRGPGFQAALYAGVVGTPENELRMIGLSVPFSTSFSGAGYFIGGTRVLDGTAQANGVLVAPGAEATLQVRAWRVADGNTWEEAFASGGGYGMSHTFVEVTGGAGSPPSPPAVLRGLGRTSFYLVPEPQSLFALATLAA